MARSGTASGMSARVRLDTPINFLKGVGPARAESLRKLGIITAKNNRASADLGSVRVAIYPSFPGCYSLFTLGAFHDGLSIVSVRRSGTMTESAEPGPISG